ncbi:MAG: hypothetical protein K6T83_13220 [Alicyclobacillus sp.]|nr:hypothetical protein [Alicyclobacillus sp.]
MSVKLYGAAGRVMITPEETIGLAGFDPGKYIAHPPYDILDDLFARVLLLDDGHQRIALVSVDCCMTHEEEAWVCDPKGASQEFKIIHPMFPKGARAQWAEAAGVPEANLIVCATHTHSAPFYFAEKYTFRIRDAIREVSVRLAPVNLSVSVGQSTISAFRRPTLYPNPAVPVDQSLYVLFIETTSGDPLATVVNYAVHPTILHPSPVQAANRVSAECVGWAMKQLEEEVGKGFVALYLQGYSGDIAPLLPGIGGTGDTYLNVKRAGNELFLSVREALRSRVSLPRGQLLVSNSEFHLPTRSGFYKDMVGGVMTGFSIGKVAFHFAPGEIFNGYVRKIRQASPFCYTFLVSLANGYIGYVPTIEAFQDGLGGYEMAVTPFDGRVDTVFTHNAFSILNGLVNP